MGTSIFGIGVSGLNAANLGLTTTGHNIANVNTDGYSRQRILQSAPYPQLSGSGYVGLGVQVDTVERIYDQFLTRQVQKTQAQSSFYDGYLQHLKEIDDIVADASAGVSPAMQDYFSAVQNVATNPSSLPSRSALIASGQTLVNRFQVFDQRLYEQRSALNGEISNTVASVNALAKQIASINGQITLASGMGQPPNDLYDQRDKMVQDLNKLVRSTTIAQSDGSINVFIGSGQNLVVGGRNFELAAVPSTTDPERTTVVYNQNGNYVYLSEDALDGGELGGLLTFRSESLDLAQNSLARVAMGLVSTFNAQHKAGMDLNGNIGMNFFDYARANSLTYTNQFGGANYSITSQTDTVPSSDFALAYTGTDYTLTRLSDNTTVNITAAQMSAGFSGLGVTVQQTGGAASTAGTLSWSFPPSIGTIAESSKNTGSGTLTGYISDVSQLKDSNYELYYDGSNYVLNRLSDDQRTTFTAAQVAAGPVSADGMTFSIGGTWSLNDRQSVQPYKSFVSSLGVRITDPREVAAGSPVRMTSDVANTGSAKLTQPTIDSPSAGLTTNAGVNAAVRNPVTIQFTSSTTFDATDTTTGVVTSYAYSAGMTLSMNGWSLKIDGSPALGDVFTVNANTAGSEDNRNALSLGQLQTTKLLSGGTATYQDTYAQMVATIGIQTNEASIMSDAQATMLSQAETSRDSVSGVNLDEEAANLLRYQQAYMAASKVIQIAQQAFEEVLNIGR